MTHEPARLASTGPTSPDAASTEAIPTGATSMDAVTTGVAPTPPPPRGRQRLAPPPPRPPPRGCTAGVTSTGNLHHVGHPPHPAGPRLAHRPPRQASS